MSGHTNGTAARAQGTTLHLSFRASVAAVPDARHQLTHWLNELDIPGALIDDLALAATELMTNAVEASPSTAAEVRLRAKFHRPDVSLEVVDEGPGFTMNGTEEVPGPEESRGRGLPIVRALVDLIEVERADRHTRVVATRRLDRERI